MASTKKNEARIKQSTLFKWKINALGRLKMLFQRPHISKSSRGASPRTPVAARAFGARDCPPTLDKSNLATALFFAETLLH